MSLMKGVVPPITREEVRDTNFQTIRASLQWLMKLELYLHQFQRKSSLCTAVTHAPHAPTSLMLCDVRSMIVGYQTSSRLK